MSAAPIQQTERQRLMAILQQDVREGRVQVNSTEWNRRRDEARRTDPAWCGRKAAADRARYARQKQADRAGYLAMIRQKTEAARARRAASGVPEPGAKRALPGGAPLEHEDAQWRSCVAFAAEIERRERPALACMETTMRRGFLVRCIRVGSHAIHVGAQGDRW